MEKEHTTNTTRSFSQCFHVKETVVALVVLGLFILASEYSKTYEQELTAFFDGRGIASIISYLVIVVVGFVLAPLNTLPLLPVAVTLWGHVVAGLVSLVGWTIGTVVTYYLSRRFGRRIVLKFMSLEKLEQYERGLSKENKFIGLVVLHALLPGDVLGYVLGLFVKIPYGQYAVASFIGNIPFALVLVFATSLDLVWQLAIGFVVIALTALGVWRVGDKILKQ